MQEPESDDDELDESKLVDKTKKACLLCKRQFPDLDKLLKHQTMSNLHKVITFFSPVNYSRYLLFFGNFVLFHSD